jgi:hydroxyethylthiazole kinase-like uncharacterized protein yjeF
LPKDTLFVILCGAGNNGGDGLAIARMLHYSGYGIKAFLLPFTQELSADCALNLQRLQKIDENLVTLMPRDTFITDIPPHIVIIDALLGTGLNRPAQDWVATFINHINQFPNRKIAIDIPSGLPADNIPDKDASIIKADDTLSFQFYKRTFLHPETGVYAGDIHILDIGLDETFIASTHSQYCITGRAAIKDIFKPRTPFSHKGSFGSVLIIGGSYGKMGAAVLSSRAALRAGAGTVTTLIPKCGYTILQGAAPEVMCRTNGEDEIGKIAEWENSKAIGIGPGLGTHRATARAFAEFIDTCKQPIIIDADALNLLSKQPELMAKVPAGSVLTPHPKEFSRLFGESVNSMMQLEQARAQAMRYNICIVLKGHHTAVIMPDGECHYNMTGNAGMATAGAGDVLTGIITGLLARGYEPGHAAVLGVYLHGLAGDHAAAQKSQEAMIAGDIIEHLPEAFKEVGSF